MTYKQALDWVVGHSINGKCIDIIFVPEVRDYSCNYQNEKWWMETFGVLPQRFLEEGTYLYFYTSQIPDDVDNNFGRIVEPDMSVKVFDNGYDWINFYKLEE